MENKIFAEHLDNIKPIQWGDGYIGDVCAIKHMTRGGKIDYFGCGKYPKKKRIPCFTEKSFDPHYIHKVTEIYEDCMYCELYSGEIIDIHEALFYRKEDFLTLTLFAESVRMVKSRFSGDRE